MREGDLSSERPTDEVHQEVDEGTKEKEGQEGWWETTVEKLSQERRCSSSEVLEVHPKTGCSVTGKTLWLRVRTPQMSGRWKGISQRVVTFLLIAGGV